MSGRFPKLTNAQYDKLLAPPSGRVRCVIDTDTRNEIDDQFALAWALLSQDKLQIEAITAAPYSFLRRWGRPESRRQCAQKPRHGDRK